MIESNDKLGKVYKKYSNSSSDLITLIKNKYSSHKLSGLVLTLSDLDNLMRSEIRKNKIKKIFTCEECGEFTEWCECDE